MVPSTRGRGYSREQSETVTVELILLVRGSRQ